VGFPYFVRLKHKAGLYLFQLEKATIEEKEKRQADFLWIAGSC
jgi:hypothetical protein